MTDDKQTAVRPLAPLLLLPLLPLALAACACGDVGPPGSVGYALRTAPDDPATMTQAPTILRRTGAVLHVRMGTTWQRLVDTGFCEGFATCDRFRVRGVWSDRFVAVDHFTGEDHDYYLYDTRLGDIHLIGALPLFGPNNRLFVVTNQDCQSEAGLHGTALWSAPETAAPRKIAFFPVEQLAMPEVVRWHGRHCIELRGRLGFEAPTFDPDGQRVTAFLVRQHDEWRLETRSRPDQCAGAAG